MHKTSQGYITGTALHYAAKKGHTNVVEYLLNNGANPKTKNLKDETPLCLASIKKHMGIVELLLEKMEKPSLKELN